MSNATVRNLSRFWSKVQITPACWLWQAARRGLKPGSPPYGLFKFNGKVQSAHRLAYEALVGPIPRGKVLDHKCHNTLCVNPDHLRPVTRALNSQNRRGLDAQNSSGYRNVVKHGDRWAVAVTVEGETHTGWRTFETAEEANEVAVKLRAHVTKTDVSERPGAPLVPLPQTISALTR